jgi:hypothetical protein
MLNNDLVHIVGAGGFGKEISYLINCRFPDLNLCIYDDNDCGDNIKPIDNLVDNQEIFGDCILAIGDPDLRRNVYNRIKGNVNLNFPNIDLSKNSDYPTYPHNSIGVGNIYMPGSILGYNSKIGSFNIIGANVGVGHDVVVGDFNFIGPNSFMAGNSKIGDSCKLSFGTFIMQNGLLSSNIKSMPYTVFYKKYKISGTYFGNPAKLI